MTTYAQYGEDTIVDALLGGLARSTVVDIGAGDGLEISNSRLFRERGWRTVLVEPDPRHHEALAALEGPNCIVVREAATPANVNALLNPGAALLSIDVDGDDIFLLKALQPHRLDPLVIVIEHNPTIPYHMDVEPARLGLRVGASVAALTRVANGKGYGLAAVTHCNAIFAWHRRNIQLPAWEPEYAVATEYFTGRPFVVGTPPWSLNLDDPYPEEDVVIR